MKQMTLREFQRSGTRELVNLPLLLVNKGKVVAIVNTYDESVDTSSSVVSSSVGDPISRVVPTSVEEPKAKYSKYGVPLNEKIENVPSWMPKEVVKEIEDIEEKQAQDGWVPTGRCKAPFCKADAFGMGKVYDGDGGFVEIALCKMHLARSKRELESYS